MRKRIGWWVTGLALAVVVVGSVVRSETEKVEGLDELAAARVEIARRAFATIETRLRGPLLREGQGRDADELVGWSRRWMEGQLALSESNEQRASAIQAHIARLEKCHAWIKGRVAGNNNLQQDADLVEYYLLEGKALLIRVRAGQV